MTDHSRWRSFASAFPSQYIVVAGDVMLDRYWYGTVERVSPEAPVVIVSKTRSVFVPGGAANTAANVAALGGKVALIGVAGCDEAAGQLAEALKSRAIEEFEFLRDESRPTTVKTRIVAHQQHVVRIDDECTDAVSEAIQERISVALTERLARAGGIILSDYAKGALTPAGIAGMISAAAAARVPVFVDPKGRDASRYRGATLLKPNRAELALLTGISARDHDSTLAAGESLLKQLPGTSILVTEGAQGMTLFQPDAEPVTFRARAKAVYDVTGAGDTVIAALALACASGAGLAEAAELATVAAARVVEKVGTDVCTLEDLLSAGG